MTYFSFSQNAFIKIFLFSTLFIFITKTSNAMLKPAGVKLFKIYTKDLGVYEYDAENRIKAMCDHLKLQYSSVKNTRDLRSFLLRAFAKGAIHWSPSISYQFDGHIDSLLKPLSPKRRIPHYEEVERFVFLTLIDFYESL